MILIGKEPGIGYITTNLPSLQTISNSPYQQRTKLFTVDSSNCISHYARMRDHQLQFRTAFEIISYLMKSYSFFISERINTIPFHLLTGNGSEHFFDLLLYGNRIYIPYHHNSGHLWRVPLLIKLNQCFTVNATDILRTTQRHTVGKTVFTDLQTIKVISYVIAAQLFQNHSAFFLRPFFLKGESVQPIFQYQQNFITYGRISFIHRHCQHENSTVIAGHSIDIPPKLHS